VANIQHKSRRWQRIALAFPVFIHGTNKAGKSVLEFGTALNVSAGGLLVALKHVPAEKNVTIEMPVPPGFYSENSFTMIESTIVRTQAAQQHVYVGLEFKTPLPC
jgi:hypothetical protein